MSKLIISFIFYEFLSLLRMNYLACSSSGEHVQVTDLLQAFCRLDAIPVSVKAMDKWPTGLILS